MSEPVSRRRTIRIPLTWVLLTAAGAAAVTVFALRSTYFLTGGNLANLFSDIAVAGIVAVPATFLMMTGCVDLSVGAAAAFCGIVLAAQTPQVGLFWATVLAVAAGLLVGLVNGVLATTLGVDTVLITFAAMGLLRALAYLIPSGLAVVVPGFRTLGNAEPIPGVPLPVLIFLAVVAAGLLVSRTRTGAAVRELGRLPWSERAAGTRRRLTLIVLFVVSGLAAAVAGLIRASELSTGLPTAATGLEISVVVSVVLGGGRLSGGRSSIVGTLLALTVISIIDNGLSLSNVTSYVNQVFHAALLMLALVVGRPTLRLRRSDGDRGGFRGGPGEGQ